MQEGKDQQDRANPRQQIMLGIDSKAVALATASAALSFALCKRQFQRRADRDRRKCYEDRKSFKSSSDAAAKERGLPSGTKIDVVTDGVYLWDVERLGRYVSRHPPANLFACSRQAQYTLRA